MKLMNALRSRHGAAETDDAMDDARRSSRRLADDTLEALHGGMTQAQSRARDLADGVRDQLAWGRDRTAGYVKDEPVKALLMAAAAGALVAIAVRAMTRR